VTVTPSVEHAARQPSEEHPGEDYVRVDDDFHFRPRTAPIAFSTSAAGGYPDAYAKGKSLTGLDKANGEARKVFHAGTNLEGDDVVTNGGRVLCAVGLGDTVAAAASAAYSAVDEIHWDEVYFRRDIGHRAIARERQAG
jgi:phosphoribosylamine-glycine ligase